MKTKLKDFLIYSLACIGIVSLFISATTQSQETTSIGPESHVWKMSNIYEGSGATSIAYMWNTETGETYRIRGNKKSKVN